MDRSAENCELETERRGVQRRLVQSTLFPHKPQQVESNGVQKDNKECNSKDEDGDDDDEECCGSQGRKSRKRKGKATPTQTRDSKQPKQKQLASTTPKKRRINTTPKKNGTSNGKTVNNSMEDDNASPPVPKQLASITSKKRRISTTPKRNSRAPKKNGMSNGKALNNLMENENASPPIPNLRLEAKMNAEENSRMFAGKKIHPFFSSWKVGKRSNETEEIEGNLGLVERKNNITTGPIHVCENSQDDFVSLDWGNWTFCDKTFINSTCNLDCTSPPVFKASVHSLNFGQCPSFSQPYDASAPQDKNSLNLELLGENLCREISLADSTMLADDRGNCCQLVRSIEVECDVGEIGPFSAYGGCVKKSDAEQQSKFFEKRMMAYYLGCGNLPEDSLWVDKYRPKNAMEVCGNDDSTKFLSDWLRLWRERDCQASKDSTGHDKCYAQDTAYNGCLSDSDSENMYEQAGPKKVLLITGPVGSGKSAAVYACAKEQGFIVLEVNTSDWRNGATMKIRFGEALKSQCLQRSVENTADLQRRPSMNSSPPVQNGKVMQDNDNEVTEVIQLSDEENSYPMIRTSGKDVCKESGTACDRQEVRSLILFEDVDVTFHDDCGFLAAVQQIAENAKGPVILTSNRKNPVLPGSLDRLEVCFTVPSPRDLLCHLNMICATERANTEHHLLEQLIVCCQGDIRKTIMHLQFWCQGKTYRKDKTLWEMCSPLLFDLNAGHQMLPRIIPWDFPSQLSELVEKEITRSLSMMEENSSFMDGIEEVDDKVIKTDFGMDLNVTDGILEAKETMLSRNCSVYSCDELEFFNSSGNPVSSSRQRRGTKLAMVISSDSEDEDVSNMDSNKELVLEFDGRFPSHSTAMENCLNTLTEKLVAENLENHYQCSESAIDLNMNDTCRSADVSCVPESSFVPETLIDDGTELLSRGISCGHTAEAIEASSMSDLKLKMLPVEAGILVTSITGLQTNLDVLGKSCDAAESSHEEVEDSQIQVEMGTREYEVMDECSRMDFLKKLKPIEKPRPWIVTDVVQESWKKLRDCHADLRHYVTLEQKDAFQIMKLTDAISSIISEADLLLSKCEPLDSSEVLTVTSEVPDAVSWCEEQQLVALTVAELGFFSYARDISAMGLDRLSESRVDLSLDMLSSTTDMMVLGKLIRKDMRTSGMSHSGRNTEMHMPKSDMFLKSEMRSHLLEVMQSIVPSKSYLGLKGCAFHEYLSSLGCISRTEASRISKGIGKTKRRARGAQHYLSTGALMLSPEDISLLDKYSSCGKSSSQSIDANLS